MFEDCEEASAEERGKNEVLRKLSREIWLKMVDTIADTPFDKRKAEAEQAIRLTKFETYKEIRDLVESMMTDKIDSTTTIAKQYYGHMFGENPKYD